MAPASTDKPEVVALNKADTIDAELLDALAAELEAACGPAVLAVSGATGAGVEAVLDALLAPSRRARRGRGRRRKADWSPL